MPFLEYDVEIRRVIASTARDRSARTVRAWRERAGETLRRGAGKRSFAGAAGNSCCSAGTASAVTDMGGER